MKLSSRTSLHTLLESYPFLEELLIAYNPKYKALRNKAMRATVGRVATLARVAAIGGDNLDDLLTTLADAIQKETGTRPELQTGEEQQPRIEQLKGIIRKLHQGQTPEQVREEFGALIADIDPTEIAAMEEQLMQEGMPVSEVQRLCDVHVQVFAGTLEAQAEVEAPAGHPVHTHMAENAIITGLANKLDSLLKRLAPEPTDDALAAIADDVAATLDELGGLENHYVRKENAIFPELEKHEITGPTQVMWGVHDDIRGQLKAVRNALDSGLAEPLHKQATALVRAIVEMVFKENRILFPLAMESLDDEAWRRIRDGEDEFGYAFAQPAAPWPSTPNPPPKEVPATFADGLIPLRVGALTLEQLQQVLRILPVECSFVDADGYVRFYSDHEHRLFPRMPGVIGRHVEKCHPPKSLHMVRAILAHFAAGTRENARFWIEMQGRFIVISYHAVRDDAGTYLGCLEVTQDATEIRRLEGEKRLLEWDT